MTENRVLSWTPRAVVFDCDGVLMSTEEYCLLSKVLVLREHGVEPDADVLASLKGLHYSAAGDTLARSLGTSASAEECSAQALAKQRELYRTRPSHALPGALDLVKRTSAVMPVACATSSPQDAVEHVLARAGILPYLVCVTSPTMGFAPKPAPTRIWPPPGLARSNRPTSSLWRTRPAGSVPRWPPVCGYWASVPSRLRSSSPSSTTGLPRWTTRS